MAEHVLLLGGPFHMSKVDLTATPKTILVAGNLYEQIVDPEVGDFLGGYAFVSVQGYKKRCCCCGR